MVRPIPDGYCTVTPYLTVADAAGLIRFLEAAFGAEVRAKALRPDGTVGNAELRIGDSMVMVADAKGPWQPRPTTLYLYVEDADAWYRRAVDAGAKSLMAPTDMFYGDRSGGVEDPAGNQWWVATHVEDVSPEELDRRMAALQG